MTGLYVFTGHGNCRSCGAPTLWFRTPAGRNIPVDDRKEVAGGGMLSRGDDFSDQVAKDSILPFNHFSICPDAKDFRRAR